MVIFVDCELEANNRALKPLSLVASAQYISSAQLSSNIPISHQMQELQRGYKSIALYFIEHKF